MRTRTAIAGTLMLILAACAEPAPPGDGADLVGRTWILDPSSVAALLAEAPADARATIRFDDGEVGGTAACNLFGGTYTLGEGDAIAIAVGAMTEMACEEPLMALEAAFVEALGEVRSFRVDGDVLTLDGDGVTMSFDAERPLPLEGTAWRLDGIAAGGDAVSSTLAGTKVTARFAADGTVVGRGGCNEYGGAYTVDGAAIAITDVVQTMMACEDDVMAQEAAFFDGLARAASFAIEGSTLSLSDTGGRFLLSFVA
ncbi:MAG TPA: META domain-containing protein [Actinomycetota bacterium]